MMANNYYDVIVIGAGPAGLAAALAAEKRGAKTLLVDKDDILGGILKQCIYDEFGLVRFNEKLTGPEYIKKFTCQIPDTSIAVSRLTYVTKIRNLNPGFELTLISKAGLLKVECKSIILACGCRERVSRQMGFQNRCSAGIFTAGTVQYYLNILGKMPTKRCVILGSNDLGLNVARQLKIEGAEVLGVYEAKSSAAGLQRNVYQCLEDYNIPLYTKKTVTNVFNNGRLNAVEISSVDDHMVPIPGTEERVSCDALILSVGLVPSNELIEGLHLNLDDKTKGPLIDQNYMTMLNGVFCCGNALHINDLVDYVTESGEAAGSAAAHWLVYDCYRNAIHKQDAIYGNRSFAEVSIDNNMQYIIPQRVDLNEFKSPVIFNFRPKLEMGKTSLTVTVDDIDIYKRNLQYLCPSELVRIELDMNTNYIKRGSIINFSLKESV